ncbi:MAG: hypothetical protein QF415_06865 [Candidatus Undinarchaeales archaeon]|jgi:hypothetical protein|nr:hypothetical protein [Candidatus Undinarchaeales archaeon]MDP7491722.1 hypothetical protein [Candidatus Undinarchaeales archaeon]
MIRTRAQMSFMPLAVVILGLLFLTIGLILIYNAREIQKSEKDIVLFESITSIHNICRFWKNPGLYVDVAMPNQLGAAFESAGLNKVNPCSNNADGIRYCMLKCEALERLVMVCNVHGNERNVEECSSTNIRSLLTK